MISQLGMVTPFFHAGKCGGQIRQEKHPTLGGSGAFPHMPPLKYFCIECQKFVELEDVVEKRFDEKPKPIVKKEAPNVAKPGVNTTPTANVSARQGGTGVLAGTNPKPTS